MKISIVTPSYNQGNYLEKTLQSVLQQSHRDLEYIVMDGGSSDESVSILQQYSSKLSFWRSLKDGGQADAINEGFKISRGEVLGWVNSDDLLLPGTLSAVSAYFDKYPGVDCVIGGSLVINEGGQLLRGRRIPLPVINPSRRVTYKSLVFLGCGFHQPASFWRRSAFEAVGGLNTQYRFSFDYDMYLKFARKKRLGSINRYLAAFRVHSSSMTTKQQWLRLREDKIILRDHSMKFQHLQAPLYKIFVGYPSSIRTLLFRALFSAGLIGQK